MALSLDEVRRIAMLARIEITEEEAGRTLEQLNRIFGLIEQMQAVDTTGIAPMAHARDVNLRLRDDAVSEPERREQFQACAPQVEAGLYLVPKVIE